VRVPARSATTFFRTESQAQVAYVFTEVGGGAVVAQSGVARIATKSVVILADIEGQEVVIRFDPTQTSLVQLGSENAAIAYGNFAPGLSGDAGVAISEGSVETRLQTYALTDKYLVWADVRLPSVSWAADRDDAATFEASLPLEPGWYYFGVVVDGPDDSSEMLLAPLGTWNDN
jgi:hypothetical protein